MAITNILVVAFVSFTEAPQWAGLVAAASPVWIYTVLAFITSTENI